MWTNILRDKEFWKEPEETRRQVANNYFNQEIATGVDFQAESPENKATVKDNIFKSIKKPSAGRSFIRAAGRIPLVEFPAAVEEIVGRHEEAELRRARAQILAPAPGKAGTAGSIVGGILPTAAAMVSHAIPGVGPVVGPVATDVMLSYFATTAAGSVLGEMREHERATGEEIHPATKVVVAAGVGAAVFVAERLGLEKILKVSNSMSPLAYAAIGKAMKSGSAKTAAATLIKEIGKVSATIGAVEGIEESVEQIITDAYEAAGFRGAEHLAGTPGRALAAGVAGAAGGALLGPLAVGLGGVGGAGAQIDITPDDRTVLENIDAIKMKQRVRNDISPNQLTDVIASAEAPRALVSVEPKRYFPEALSREFEMIQSGLIRARNNVAEVIPDDVDVESMSPQELIVEAEKNDVNAEDVMLYKAAREKKRLAEVEAVVEIVDGDRGDVEAGREAFLEEAEEEIEEDIPPSVQLSNVGEPTTRLADIEEDTPIEERVTLLNARMAERDVSGMATVRTLTPEESAEREEALAIIQAELDEDNYYITKEEDTVKPTGRFGYTGGGGETQETGYYQELDVQWFADAVGAFEKEHNRRITWPEAKELFPKEDRIRIDKGIAEALNHFHKMYPGIDIEAVNELYTKEGGIALGQSLGGLIQWVEGGALEETIPHEYFHEAMRMMRGSEVYNEAIKKFKKGEESEIDTVERLTSMIADLAVTDINSKSIPTRLRHWLKKFWASVKEMFGKGSREDFARLMEYKFFRGALFSPTVQNALEQSGDLEPSIQLQTPTLNQAKASIYESIGEEPQYETLESGQRIVTDIPPEPGGLSILMEQILSSEFVVRNLEKPRENVGEVIDAELEYSHKVNIHTEILNAYKNKLTTPEQIEVRGMMGALRNGTVEEVAALKSKNPKVAGVAERLNHWLDLMREKAQNYKRLMFALHMPNNLIDAFESVMVGETNVDQAVTMFVAKKGPGSKRFDNAKASIIDLLKEFKSIDSWGLDNYITNMERGQYRFVNKQGVTITVGVTKKDAVEKVKDYLDRNPDVDRVFLEIGPSAFQNPAMRQRIMDDLAGDAEEINTKVMKSKPRGKSKPRWVSTKSVTYKHAGPMTKRMNVLQGEENVFDVLYSYAYAMEKKMTLDPVIHKINQDMKNNPLEYTPDVEKFMTNLIDDTKGRYWWEDRVVDRMVSKLGIGPQAFSRGVAKARWAEANLKLGYRPIGGFINWVSGLEHTWTKVGTRLMVDAHKFLQTDDGKAWLKEMVDVGSLGMDFITASTGKQITKQKWYTPTKVFGLGEPHTRSMSLAANYLLAKSKGMSEDAARLSAKRGIRLQQLTYNLSALPRILRRPSGKLFGQFKRYLIGEIEFISTLRGKEIVRHLSGQMLLAGPRGVIYIFRSLPFIGAWVGIDRLEEALNEYLPRASRGIFGAFGGDITAPAVVQLPHRVEDWAGPLLSDMIKLMKYTIQPALRGEKIDLSNVTDWVKGLSPMAYYWDQIWQSMTSEDEWVRSRDGFRLYKPTTYWDRALLSTGVTPMSLSQQRVIDKILQQEDSVNAANRRKVLRKVERYFRRGAKLPDKIKDDAAALGMTAAGIKKSLQLRGLDPEDRRRRYGRKGSRARAAALYETAK